MPAKSLNEYSEAWRDGSIQRIVRERANHRCEECGLEFQCDTNISKMRCSNGKYIIGTCHHIDHNRANDDLNNIVFLCQRCHVRLHGANWKPGSYLLKRWLGKPPKWIVTRRIDYRTPPQMTLPFFD